MKLSSTFLLLQLVSVAVAVSNCDPLVKICTAKSCLPTSQFQIGSYNYDYSDFNAISFGDFHIEDGDTEGRTALSGKFFQQDTSVGVSIGDKLNTSALLPYSLIAGGSVEFQKGEVFPVPDAKIFVGENGGFTGDSYLANKVVYCGATGCIDGQFTTMKNYFQTTSTFLNGLSVNTNSYFASTTFHVECQGTPSDNIFVISTTAALFSTISGYVLTSCPSDAYFVFNIVGNEGISFTGGQFPTPAVVYNYVGNGATTSTTSVMGSILAVNSALDQSVGVINGNVIFATVNPAKQINLPHCPAQNGGGIGDPMIVGFNRNLRFWFNGQVGGVFNLYNDQYLNANSRFRQANEKNGTVMESIAVEVAGHRISYSILDPHNDESMEVILDGKKTIVRFDSVQHLTGCVELGMKKGKYLSIRTPMHDVKIKFGKPTGDGYITVDHLDFDINPPRKNHRKVGGVIGQTATNQSDRRDESFSVTELYGTEKSKFYLKTSFNC